MSPVLAVIALSLAAVAATAQSEDDDVIVLAPGERSAYWVLDRATVERNVKPRDVPRGAIGCAAVSFIIERNGSTSTFKLLRSTPEGQWDELSRKVVAGLSFKPGEKNPRAEVVFTYLTITYTGQGNEVLGTHLKPRVQLDDRMNEMCEVKGMQIGQ